MTNTQQQHLDPKPSPAMVQTSIKRPFLVTLLAVLVLIISCVNLIRFIEALRMWDFLTGLPGVSPIYIALTGLFWTLVGFPLAWSLWRGYTQAPKATRIFTLLFALYYWLDRLLIAQNVDAGSNWLFAAICTVVMILFNFWALARSQKYFGTTTNRTGRFSKD